jgi:lipopolysaccharide transport system permease protein
MIVIEPNKKWYDLDWQRMWRQRDLLKSLILRDLRLRYRQTLLGIFWTILQPLAPMLVFCFVFYRLFSEFNQSIPYPIFVLAGLVSWLYFSNTVSKAGLSLVNNSYLIGKIYFPRLLLPLSSVLSGAIDFAVGLGLVLLLMIYFGIELNWTILLLPFLLALLALLALAIGTIFASVSVIYRDLSNLMPFLLQLWMFLTPIVYPSQAISEKWRWLLKINPLTGIIENIRAVLVGSPLNLGDLVFCLGITLVLSLAAMIIFARVQKVTADIL